MSEFTIIGGGLAGCSLGWNLKQKGLDFRIIDPSEKVTSTLIAAGIINPITGPSLTKSPRLKQFWSIARDFYRSIEKESGLKMFRETQVVRILDSERQVEKWNRRLLNPEYGELVADVPLGLDDCFNFEHGGFVTKFGAHLDTKIFISAIKSLLEDYWVTDYFEKQPLGGTTIYCEGVKGSKNPFFDWVKFKPAKGEILTVKIPSLVEDRIIVRGNIWLLPLGNSIYRAGATYDWNANDNEPTQEARLMIEERLEKLINVSYDVIDHVAAVRPIIDSRRTLIGLHPGNDKVGFFNGLGSKGVLSAPFLAANLANHICDSSPIDPEFDLQGNI